jgi:ribosomal protein L37AE/L43A
MKMRRLFLLLLVLLVAASAVARVGGGDSYGGSSSSSSSSGSSSGSSSSGSYGGSSSDSYGGSSSGGDSRGGGGGGGGGALIFVVIATISFTIYSFRREELDSVVRIATDRAAIERTEPAPQPVKLSALRRFDPNFSEITFSDFCYSLYARAHEARGRRGLDQYAPYLSAAAQRELLSRNVADLREVKGIIIGSFRVARMRGLYRAVITVEVLFESNYTEVVGAKEKAWYVREQWTLERLRDILSPPPEKAKADHCPRCGAALRTRTDGSCELCGAKIESGAFQWFVQSIALMERRERGPVLTGGGVEVGTERPTVYQRHLADALAKYREAHPDFDKDRFLERVREIAIELQNAWTARDWERVRPLESEGLFQMHRYWIDAYLRQKLRNVVDDLVIDRIEIVKVDSDAFYESITVRIFASGRDSTVNEEGRVVGGSKEATRIWSEYWTFIRTRGAEAGTGKMTCPNCGATVLAGATGICQYCNGKLTAGSFDWILSRIEQDESYAG